MLYHLLFPLADEISIFNLFRYLTFRTGGAVLTALIISFLGNPFVTMDPKATLSQKKVRPLWVVF